MFSGKMQIQRTTAALAIWFFAASAELGWAASLRHMADSTKAAAPTQEDHATYLSTLETATPENMKKADVLRQKTIASIYKLLEKNKKGMGAFELYLRLGELHAERHDYLRDVEIQEYQKRHDDWQKNGKKGREPQVDSKGSKSELLKSASAYRKLVSNYASDKRTDAALYELGKTLGRLGNDNAVLYFNQLIKQHPKSQYIPFAHLALGEFYFDQHNIPMAMKSYKAAMKYKQSKIYPYAVYKLGWSYVNASVKTDKDFMDNAKKALAAFKLVVKLEEARSKGTGRMNLKDEATRDLIMVWADTEGVDEAWAYFSRRNDKESFYSVLERLGNIYVDQGKNKRAIEVYTRLLKEAPHRENNPEIYVKVIKLHDEEGAADKVHEDLAAMNRLYLKDSAWKSANSGKPEIVEDARKTTEHNIHRYGTLFHARGQKQKRDDYLKAAAKIYSLYLAAFPKNPTSYEIRYYVADIYYHFKQYDEAADEYTKVALEQPKGKYMKDAAYNAVVAMNDLDAKQKYDKLPPAGKVQKPMPLPRVKTKLIEVMDNYVKLLPKENAGYPMRFTAAQIYFSYGHYDVALKRFEDLGMASPKSKQGITSIKVIMTYYAEKKEWDKLIATGRRYMQNKDIMASELKAVIQDSVKNGTFQKAMALEKDKDHEKAAQLFMAYQKEFPSDENADRALYNASLNYYKIAKVDEALNAGNLLLKHYPKSPLIASVALDMAQSYEALADFPNAAKHYRDFAYRYPNDKNASGALFNAALLYKGLNQNDDAIKLFDRFVRFYPNNELHSDALKELAQIHEKNKNFNEAVKYWDRYAVATANNTESALYGKAKVAQIHFTFLNKQHGERELKSLQRLFLNKNGPAAFDARRIVAELMFNDLEDKYKRFKDIKVSSAESLQKDVRHKQNRLLDLAGRYEQVIDIGNGEFVVASLYRLGEMHENFANELFHAPAPKGANQVELDQYRSSIEKVAFPLKEESGKFYETAYKRSVEVQTFSEWTKRAYDKMVQLAPEKHPEMEEKSADPAYMSHKMEWEDALSKLID